LPNLKSPKRYALFLFVETSAFSRNRVAGNARAITIIPDELHVLGDYFMLKYAASKEQNISESKIVKILSIVPHDKGFHFFTDLGRSTGETATSLDTFAQKLERINADSVKFQFQRNDFKTGYKPLLEMVC
jgi:hypothetical protein